MAIQYNENIKIAAPAPLDKRYLSTRTIGGVQVPYSACTEVNSIIIPSERYIGLTVNINGTEYWYKDGILDNCLVEKKYDTVIPQENFITGATNLGFFSGHTGVQILPINNLVNNDYDGNYVSLYNNYYRGVDGIIHTGASPVDNINRRGYYNSEKNKSWVWNEYLDSSNLRGWIFIDGNIENQIGTFQIGTTYYSGLDISQPYTASTWTTGSAYNNGSNAVIGTVIGSLSTGSTYTVGGPVYNYNENNYMYFRTLKTTTPDFIKICYDESFVYLSGVSAVVTAQNVGTGISLYSQKNGSTLEFRTIVGSGDTTISQSGDDIIIFSSNCGSGYALTGVTNCGSGVEICNNISFRNLGLRTIKGSGDTSVTLSGDTIIVYSTGALTGATNGLHLLDERTVELGGDLISGTTINGRGLYDLSITNVDGFQVTTTGNSTVFGIDKTGFLLSFSGGGVTFNDNGGIKYASDYSSNYTNRSLVDAGYVTGITNVINSCFSNFYTKSQIDQYSASTDNRIDALEIIGANAITGGTNGLTSSASHLVCLGGTLSVNTIISGANCLKLGDLEHICLSTQNSTDIALNAKSNGAIYLKSQGGTIESSNDTTNAVLFVMDYDANAPMLITDNTATPRGLQYASDYSSTFTERSLVDKYYVDSIATGLNIHAAVIVATSENDGNIVLSGSPKIIDGISLTNGMRVLVKNQTNGALNGIYVVSDGIWSRSTDYNFTPSGEIANGDLIPVISGNTNANSQWVLVTKNPITSGDTLVFSLFSQQQGIIEGNGICVTNVGTNKQVAVKLSSSNSGLCFNSSALELDYNTFRYGLTCSQTTGKIDVKTEYCVATGSEIPVALNTGNTSCKLYVDSCTVKTCLNPVIDANNGLTKANYTVSLGGVLTGDTTVCLNGATLKFGDITTYTLINANSGAECIGVQASGNAYLNICGVTCNESSIIKAGAAYLCMNTTGCNVFFDNTALKGLEYAADYSANFTDHSLVDKAYVDSLVGNISASNGITRVGDTIILGGELTDSTCVYIPDNKCIGFGDYNSLTQFIVSRETGNESVIGKVGANSINNSNFWIGTNGVSYNAGICSIHNGVGASVVTSCCKATMSVSGNTIEISKTEISLTEHSNGINKICMNGVSGITIGSSVGVVLGSSSYNGQVYICAPITNGTTYDDVIVINSSTGELKRVSQSTLGEKNKNYCVCAISANTTFNSYDDFYVILVDSSASSVCVTLPSNVTQGRVFRIKDGSGNALTNNIIIRSEGYHTFDGNACAIINTDYGSLELMYGEGAGASEWKVLSYYN